jgi:aldose sugar dehydrogenase
LFHYLLVVLSTELNRKCEKCNKILNTIRVDYSKKTILRNAYNLNIRHQLSLITFHISKGRRQLSTLLLLFTILIFSSFATIGYPFRFALGQSDEEKNQDASLPTIKNQDASLPTINDPNLKVEEVFKGLRFPTKMAFLGPNDILVLEKDGGTVQRIVNGKMLPEPVLDVNVANKFERGLLGIAVAKHQQQNGSGGSDGGPTYVFLYYTESKVKGSDVCPEIGFICDPAGEPLGNRLYRYELINNKLVNPKLLLDLPATPNRHNGGPVTIGPDQNVYVLSGDRNHRTQASNNQNGPEADGTAGILRVTQDGKIVDNPPLGNTFPLNLYYAYGIRNGFGMDFDRISGNLWATEAGTYYVDELNLVGPGFNGGWADVDGMASRCVVLVCPYLKHREDQKQSYQAGLVDFGGKGTYNDPQFAWEYNPTPTAVKFLNSDKLGKQYQDDLFVGDFNYGNLYHFKLNPQRTELLLPSDGSLADRVSNSPDESKSIIFGTGFGGATALYIKKHNNFGGITDIEVGPDGYLYILAFRETQGTIYRVVPK